MNIDFLKEIFNDFANENGLSSESKFNKNIVNIVSQSERESFESISKQEYRDLMLSCKLRFDET
jgi:hypothetical protein